MRGCLHDITFLGSLYSEAYRKALHDVECNKSIIEYGNWKGNVEVYTDNVSGGVIWSKTTFTINNYKGFDSIIITLSDPYGSVSVHVTSYIGTKTSDLDGFLPVTNVEPYYKFYKEIHEVIQIIAKKYPSKLEKLC